MNYVVLFRFSSFFIKINREVSLGFDARTHGPGDDDLGDVVLDAM